MSAIPGHPPTPSERAVLSALAVLGAATTLGVAIACRRLPEEERRHAIGIELDGRWLDAIRPLLVADYAAGLPRGQAALFARGAA